MSHTSLRVYLLGDGPSPISLRHEAGQTPDAVAAHLWLTSVGVVYSHGVVHAVLGWKGKDDLQYEAFSEDGPEACFIGPPGQGPAAHLFFSACMGALGSMCMWPRNVREGKIICTRVSILTPSPPMPKLRSHSCLACSDVITGSF